MTYRPPSVPPRGAWARHLHEQRKLRDISQTQAFELVRERMNWRPKSRSAYIPIDMGVRQPKDFEAAVLAEEFGWPPDPVETETQTDDPASLTEALAAQTKAINDLVALLRPLVEDQGSRLAEAERLLARLGERVFAEGPAPRVPQGTKG